MKTLVLLSSCLVFISFAQTSNPSAQGTLLPNATGMSIESRFVPPKGYKRIPAQTGSFGEYLQNLPLKATGAKVRYYNGSFKYNDVYEAVVDMDIDNKNLQQCADAIIRLRAEYFYEQKMFDKISFNLTNGFLVAYTEWIKGKRVIVRGNQTYWQKSALPSNTYQDLRNYLNFVFTYAGTISLAKELLPKNIKDLAIGDVFIIGGSPGHAVIVVDMAENQKREKLFMLAQSYMPAQEIQILKNTANKHLSPWYEASLPDNLLTPEWTFKVNQLKTWKKH